jgi:hypothetical protein
MLEGFYLEEHKDDGRLYVSESEMQEGLCIFSIKSSLATCYIVVVVNIGQLHGLDLIHIVLEQQLESYGPQMIVKELDRYIHVWHNVDEIFLINQTMRMACICSNFRDSANRY